MGVQGVRTSWQGRGGSATTGSLRAGPQRSAELTAARRAKIKEILRRTQKRRSELERNFSIRPPFFCQIPIIQNIMKKDTFENSTKEKISKKEKKHLTFAFG